MTIGSAPPLVTVGTTPTLITGAQVDANPGASIAVLVPAAGQTVFVGGPSVTAATGYPWTAGSEHFMDIDPGEKLYGVVASGTQTVYVLPQGF